MQLPDYTNCGTNLIASILKYFDLKGAHQTLQAVDEMLIKGRYKNIILMLFDGMSMAALDRHLPPDSFLKKHCLSKLSAVFPSTTTAATTSIITGLNPGEHCWIGWTLYFKSLEKSIDLFWNTIQFTKEPAANYSVASSFFPYISATTLITQSGKAQGVTISPFEGHVIHDLDSLFSAVRQHLREAGSHYIYVYWPAPDNHMHQHGCDHEIVKESIINIEKALLEMKSHLGRDDLLLVTADHGLINSKPDFFEDYPLLENMLKIAPAVEPRASPLCKKRTPCSVPLCLL